MNKYELNMLIRLCETEIDGLTDYVATLDDKDEARYIWDEIEELRIIIQKLQQNKTKIK